MAANSIQVTVRVRPFSSKELPFVTSIKDSPLWIGEGSLTATPQTKLSTKAVRRIVQVLDERVLVFDPPEENPIAQYSKTIIAGGRKTKDMRYAFDRVFDDTCTQEDVFTHTAKPLLDSVLDGFNATVFAYGATGCGKTHTISGTPENPGLIYLTTQELFERCAALTDKKIDITLSFLEIYNETIRDLLVPVEESKALQLREDAQQRISVPGLTTATPVTVDEVMNLILHGNENRTSSPTEANATSSRSHAVLQINVTIKNRTGDLSEESHHATLSIIDLAGSERASVTKNRGARLFEGANINKSLLALGNCINALCDANRRGHIPYRDSKLTRLLKFSLGGNCKTVMIVCISPSSVHYDETHNTLKYGNRAKEIKTKVSRNTLNFDRHVSQYVKLIYELRQEIAELKEKSKSHSNEVEEGFKKQLERYRKLTEEAISQVQSGQERARANIEEMGNLRALITCIENAKKLVEGWLRRYQGLVGEIAVGAMNLPEVFKTEAERKKADAEELLKCLSERHRNYISRLMFLQGGEGNIFEQSCKSALRMLTNNGVDEFHMEYVKAEIRACKATMERDAAIRQGLKMEEDTTHYVTSLSSWIDTNFNSVNELAHNADWTSEGAQELSASVQTLWDFTAKLFRFKAAKYLGQQESPNRPFLSTASTILTPSRKARFLAQFEGSPVMPSPRRSPRKFKVGTPKRNAAQVKRKSPKKEKKKVRWTEAPPQEFQLPQDLTPIPSPAVFPVLQPSTEDDSFTETKPEQPEQPSRPILPLPLRKRKSTQQFGGGILKQGVPPLVTEFGSLQQDDSFLSNTSSQNSPLKEISPPGQLRSKPSRTDLSAVDPGSLRGTKRPGTITASPGRAKRVFSASSVPNNNKENGLPSVRRASDSPVKHGPGGCVTRRMTLGGSAGRVTNPGWGSMGPPAAAAAASSAVKTVSPSDQGSLRRSAGKRGWR